MSRSLLRTCAIAAVRLAYAAFAIAAFSASTSAAPYISFVAANGNDANPCTVVTAPCKTLQRAVNVTPANGTVSVLTPLQGHVTINKSITISGDGTPIVGTITISGTSTKATLRGLELNGVGIIATGIRIYSAVAIHIEDCTVERYTGDGITLGATNTYTFLFVSDTVSRDNGGSGLSVGNNNAHVTIDNSRFERNDDFGVVLGVAGSNISRSVASGNIIGIFLVGGKANVTETTATGNVTGEGFSLIGGAFATLTSSVARGNARGLSIDSSSNAVISNSVFTSNEVGIQNNGNLYTLVNNTNLGNLTDYSAGGGVKTTVSPGF